MRLALPGLIFMGLIACDSLSFKHAENTQAATVEGSAANASEARSPAPVPESPDTNTACLFSQMAYCPDPQAKLDSFLPGWKLQWYPGKVNSNHAWAASNGNQWAIVFRGSLMEISWHAFDNWINQDLNIITQVKWPYGPSSSARISQGAQNSLNNLLALKDSTSGQSLTEFLLSKLTTENELLFTGHSLGGSLAIVYAAYLRQHWLEKRKPPFPNSQLICFATPAPGNDAFADEFGQNFKRIVRVESTGDIVARFPCVDRIEGFSKNCAPLAATDQVKVSYQGMNVSLQRALEIAGLSLSLLELKNGGRFKAVGGDPVEVKIKPRSSNPSTDVQEWFSGAGFQHGIAQYAAALNVPVLVCP